MNIIQSKFIMRDQIYEILEYSELFLPHYVSLVNYRSKIKFDGFKFNYVEFGLENRTCAYDLDIINFYKYVCVIEAI